MGFIEDEKKRIAAGLSREQVREQQEAASRESNRKAAEAKREADGQKARQYLDQSGLRGMVDELGRIGSHRGVDTSLINDARIHIDIGGELEAKVTIICFSNGAIRIVGNGLRELSKDKWQGKDGQEKLEEALGEAYLNPAVRSRHSYGGSSDREYDTSAPGNGPCLSGNSLISTPNGLVLVKNLKSGDLVWTVDRFGHRVQAVIMQKTKRLVSKDHKMAHIVLEDGRELIVSPGHPTIDNKEIGNLVKGQVLDKSQIVSVKIMSYRGKYTHDILPFGDTGAYWANDILIGSTLSNQFKQTQWHRQLFV